MPSIDALVDIDFKSNARPTGVPNPVGPTDAANKQYVDAAVEGALQDGTLSERERSVLARVADQLGLSAMETLEIEREARAALSKTA